MKRFSIRDIECLTGIKAHTIRIWEQRYDLVPPKRTETNIRYYDSYDLKKFLNISTLLNNGYKVSKVAQMDGEEMCQIIAELTEDNFNCDKGNSLCTATLKLDERVFDNVISSCISLQGIEKTYTDVIFPFMRKIGMMWQVGTINPAHEHFITHLIKQKLLSAIDDLPTVDSDHAKKYLLFLPEGETHEIGLLFANYLLKSNGQYVLYLGQNLPLNDLRQVADYYQPDFVITTLTSDTAFGDINTLVKKLLCVIETAPVLLTGPLVNCNDIETQDRLYTLKDIEDLRDFIKTHSLQSKFLFTC